MFKFKRSFCGPKDDAILWPDLVISHFTDLGFHDLEYAPCIFKMDNQTTVLYVDDVIVFGQTDSKINELPSSPSKSFKVKDLGLPAKFLRIELNWETKNEVSTNQAFLADKLLQQTGLENCLPVDIPVVPAISYKDRLNAARLSTEEHHRFSSKVGTLIYFAIKIRADLCVATSILGSLLAKLCTLHMQTEKGQLVIKKNNVVGNKNESESNQPA